MGSPVSSGACMVFHFTKYYIHGVLKKRPATRNTTKVAIGNAIVGDDLIIFIDI